MTVIYEKLAVIGIGLIGSSVALAARRAGAVGHIVGCDADPAVMPEVEKAGTCGQFHRRRRYCRCGCRSCRHGGAGRRRRRARGEDHSGNEGRGGADGHRLHQTVGDPGCRATSAAACPLAAVTPACRYRAFRTGGRFRRSLHRPLLAGHPGRGAGGRGRPI